MLCNLLIALSAVGLLYSLKQLDVCPKAVLFGGTIRASQYKGSVDMRVDTICTMSWNFHQLVPYQSTRTLWYWTITGIFISCSCSSVQLYLRKMFGSQWRLGTI